MRIKDEFDLADEEYKDKKLRDSERELSCETCRKCGETTCGDDSVEYRCYEPVEGV